MIPPPEAILRHVRRHAGRKTRPLAEALGVEPEEFERFVEALLDLQLQGEILKLPFEGWTVPEATEYRVGAIRLSRRGDGVVALSKPERGGDIRVRANGVGHAFHGDTVMVRVAGRPPRPRGRGRERQGRSRLPALREGRVVEVLRRSPALIRGHFWAADRPGGAGLVKPIARYLPTEIYVAGEDSAAAREGEKVLVRLIDREPHGVYPRGRVVARVEEGTLEGDFRAIAAEFGFPVEHPGEALAEAEGLAEPEAALEEELRRGRRDLRGLTAITIDPADARDFDDAVSLEPLPDGGARLGVHIADVSHYAPSGSALDRSAALRGTSIYLPGRVVGMLPGRLSNDLASLLPGRDRLTKTVLIDFDREGEPRRVEVLRSVIRNRRRFTYEEALALLDEADRRRGGSPALPRAAYPRDRAGVAAAPGAAPPPDAGEHLDLLSRMADLRDRLWNRRHQRGALDLDVPRLRLCVDEAGEVTAVGRDERDPSHHLIEEFMLAANEAVARHCGEKGIPYLARVHPPPGEDRIEEFFFFLERAGWRRGRPGSPPFVSPGGRAGSRDLQRAVEATAGEPLAPVIHLMLLQSLAHAEYSETPALHFALATATYCHFTSPIRRYPDLLLHQALDEHWEGKLRSAERALAWEQALERHAMDSSAAERRAEQAEREMVKLRLIRHLQPRLGEEMEAMVASVHPFGFFVRVEESLLEGLVHIASLSDDFYEYDEDALCLRGQGRRRTFKVGDRVRVALAELNPDFREIGFRFLGAASGERQRRGERSE